MRKLALFAAAFFAAGSEKNTSESTAKNSPGLSAA